MKLLLDTHIWLWARLEPQKLHRRVSRELERPGNDLWLSPMSMWELIILERSARMEFGSGAGAWIEAAMKKVPLKEAPLTFEVAMASRGLTLPHRDPADLLIAATAKVYGLTLVTGDTNLLGVSGLPVLSNR